MKFFPDNLIIQVFIFDNFRKLENNPCYKLEERGGTEIKGKGSMLTYFLSSGPCKQSYYVYSNGHSKTSDKELDNHDCNHDILYNSPACKDSPTCKLM